MRQRGVRRSDACACEGERRKRSGIFSRSAAILYCSVLAVSTTQYCMNHQCISLAISHQCAQSIQCSVSRSAACHVLFGCYIVPYCSQIPLRAFSLSLRMRSLSARSRMELLLRRLLSANTPSPAYMGGWLSGDRASQQVSSRIILPRGSRYGVGFVGALRRRRVWACGHGL